MYIGLKKKGGGGISFACFRVDLRDGKLFQHHEIGRWSPAMPSGTKKWCRDEEEEEEGGGGVD